MKKAAPWIGIGSFALLVTAFTLLYDDYAGTLSAILSPVIAAWPYALSVTAAAAGFAVGAAIALSPGKIRGAVIAFGLFLPLWAHTHWETWASDFARIFSGADWSVATLRTALAFAMIGGTAAGLLLLALRGEKPGHVPAEELYGKTACAVIVSFGIYAMRQLKTWMASMEPGLEFLLAFLFIVMLTAYILVYVLGVTIYADAEPQAGGDNRRAP